MKFIIYIFFEKKSRPLARWGE